MSPSLSSANFILLTIRRSAAHSTGKVSNPALLPLSILLFVAVTVSWTAHIYRAFVSFETIQRNLKAEIDIADRSQPSALVEDSFISLCFVLGDSMIIYRLWVVWSHSKLILVIPVLTLTVFAIGSSISISVAARSSDILANSRWIWIKSLPSLNLITNIYCTSFIGWRIWSVTRLSVAAGGSKLRHFLTVVVESAALYAIWIVFAIVFATKSNVELILIEAGPELIGLVNALIMTRVGLGWTSEQIEGPPSGLVFAGSCGTPGPATDLGIGQSFNI
ncbi:hypothetical protein C8R46DRAFT_1347875 [Mycena filopes]|nr:hypothetical protein C8R46DRAFT_1347875 [Mycena filopes]